MTTHQPEDHVEPETAEAPETEMPDTEDVLLEEVDTTADPETPAHQDVDPETLAHADDADEETLAGRVDAGPLEGQEDGRLLD